MLYDSLFNQQNNTELIAISNSTNKNVKLTQVQKDYIFKIAKENLKDIINTKNFNYNDYFNSASKKYHISKENLNIIKNIKNNISNKFKENITNNDLVHKNNKLFNNNNFYAQNNSISPSYIKNQLNSLYNSGINNDFQHYLTSTKNIAIVTTTAAVVATAAAFAYWAGAWFFGITIPDALAATADAVGDAAAAGIFWNNYYGIKNNSNQFMSKITNIINFGTEIYSIASLGKTLDMLQGNMEMIFRGLKIGSATIISVEAVEDASAWAVPITAILSLATTALDTASMIMSNSANSVFETLSTLISQLGL